MTEGSQPEGRAVVVDDDRVNLYYAGKILRDRGYKVASAQSYFEALQALDQNNTALLLADIRLPAGNGLELARFVHERYPNVKVLLMTAYTEEELRATDLKLPVIRVPFSKRELVNHLHRLFI